MPNFQNRSRAVRASAAAGVLVFALAGCGGSSSSSSSGTGAASSTPTASATGAPGGFRNGAGGAQFAAIQSCLTAAGIAVPTRTAFPRVSGARPTAFPSGVQPSGVRPSGGFGGGGGGFDRGMFASAKVKAALKACGITIPTGRPSVAPTAS